MSEIKVNSIKGVGASTAAITVNNSDGTATANLTNRQGKNLVVNGACNIAQRGTSSNVVGYKTVDRFTTSSSGLDESPTYAQVDISSGGAYDSGFRKAFRVQNGNQSSGAGSADFIELIYKIEAQDIANSGWDYTDSSSFVTLSFWCNSSVAQNFFFFLKTSDGTAKQYPFQTGSLSANTWTKITKTIPGHADLQFSNDTGEGLRIDFPVFYGTDKTNNSATVDQWANYNGAARTPDHTSTWYTTDNATFQITGLQLELGSVATEFEHLSRQDDYLRCARYFQGLGGTRNYFVGRTSNSDGLHTSPSCPVPMRATPTISGGGSYELFSSSGQGSSSTTPTIDAYSGRDFDQCFLGNVYFVLASGTYCSDARVGVVRIADTLNFDSEI